MSALSSTLAAALILACGFLPAQERTQTIRGRVIDKYALSPLPGAAVVLLDADPPRGVATDSAGHFRLDGVPVGRAGIAVSFLGYRPVTIANLELTSGKQVVLTIELEEIVVRGAEVVITAEREKDKALNDMAMVSARMFSVEETHRYAGSFNDPSRMAANFAGVSGSSDQRNDIIIRGNSPVGLLWRLEGVDIPSPNHFNAQGSNGGPVSILNNNLLANSDFMTGAFPAEYGNALAGVFDLRMRTGNSEKREYTFQVGFNGAELMLEGPFAKGPNSSYLASYRYSTLDIFDRLGIDFGTAGIPRYQDLSYMVRLRAGGRGHVDLFGLGGISHIELLDSERKPTDNTFGLEDSRDVVFGTDMGAAGIAHTFFWDERTHHKLAVALSGTRRNTAVDSLPPPPAGGTLPPANIYNENSGQWKATLSYYIIRKFNARHNLKTGVAAERQSFRLNENVLDNGSFRDLRDFSGSTYFVRAYAQWRYRISDALALTSGLHFQRLTLNNSHGLEPRFGLKWEVRPGRSFSLGCGLHSQLQLPEVYFYRTDLPGGGSVLTNRNLGMNRSRQAVLGYDHSLSQHVRLKTEAYFQYLYNIPVEAHRSTSFSVINVGTDFIGLPELDSLANEGTGVNYGVELTLEKFFSRNYYYLFTLSLYESKYSGSDGRRRNTTFNGNFVWNSLAGKEFRLGRNNILTVDVRLTYAGGKRYTPFDLQKSVAAGSAVYKDGEAFTRQYPHYFRTDMSAGFRINAKRVSHEWVLDVQNVFGTQNVLLLNYNSRTNTEQFEYQLGVFPVFQYRVMF